MKAQRKIFLLFLLILISFVTNISFSQPHTEWVQRFNSPENYDDYVSDMAIDKYGNVYLTGYIQINDTNQDFITIKYNSSGIQQWAKYYDGPDHREDRAGFVAVDDSGNVFVAGSSYSRNSSYDFLTIKYALNGDSQWVQRFTIGLIAGAMEIDKKQNVYVTGGTIGSDIITIKYNSQGNLLWSRYYNGTADAYDIPLSINIDNNSNIYVAGQSTENSSVVPKGIIIKYRENGEQRIG